MSEVSQTEEKGEISYDTPYMWNLRRNDTTERIYKTERDLQTEKWTYGCQGEGVVRDLGKVMYTLLYLKWITNKDLLSSTWNSAQCYRPSWDGSGVWGRLDPCLCTAESLHCSSETTTTLLTGYTPIQNVFGVKKKEKLKNETEVLIWFLTVELCK